MARKAREGIDYFPVDVHIFTDVKFRKAIMKYGGVVHTVYLAMLSKIYADKGYYALYAGEDKEDFIFSLRESLRDIPNLTYETLPDMIDCFIDSALFDRDSAQKGILTSKRIQTEYFNATLRRKVVNFRPDIWLVSLEELESISANAYITIQLRMFMQEYSSDVPKYSSGVPKYSSDVPKYTEYSTVNQNTVDYTRVDQNTADKTRVQETRVEDSRPDQTTKNYKTLDQKTADKTRPEYITLDDRTANDSTENDMRGERKKEQDRENIRALLNFCSADSDLSAEAEEKMNQRFLTGCLAETGTKSMKKADLLSERDVEEVSELSKNSRDNDENTEWKAEDSLQNHTDLAQSSAYTQELPANLNPNYIPMPTDPFLDKMRQKAADKAGTFTEHTVRDAQQMNYEPSSASKQSCANLPYTTQCTATTDNGISATSGETVQESMTPSALFAEVEHRIHDTCDTSMRTWLESVLDSGVEPAVLLYVADMTARKGAQKPAGYFRTVLHRLVISGVRKVHELPV